MKKVSIVMSGSTWTRLTNAMTLRPVSSSIVCVDRSAMTRWKFSHRDRTLGFAAVHDRLLARGETTPAQNDDDHVVQRAGLGVGRAATVMLVQHPNDAVGDRRQ
jgi:hypothetical protein